MNETLENMKKDFSDLLGGKRASSREQYENVKKLIREKYATEFQSGTFGKACQMFIPENMRAGRPQMPALPSFVVSPHPSNGNGNGKTADMNLTGLLRKIAKDTGELPNLRIIAVMAEYSGKSASAGNASMSLLRNEFDIQAGKIDGFKVSVKEDPRIREIEESIARLNEQLVLIKGGK